MQTILVTGYEGFKGHDNNPSWDMLQHLPESIGNARIVKLQLPVVFAGFEERVREAIAEHKPAAVLSFGLHGECDDFSIETRGYNFQEEADNAGVNPLAKHDETLDASHSYPATIPFDFVADALGDIPCHESTDAGRYLCNAMIYILGRINQERTAAGEPELPYIFVHVPARDDDPQFSDNYRKVPFSTLQLAATRLTEAIAARYASE